MYRDGVGDGQLETVNKFEVPQLLATFCSIEANYKPELAVIIVQKRINTRLMLTKVSCFYHLYLKNATIIINTFVVFSTGQWFDESVARNDCRHGGHT